MDLLTAVLDLLAALGTLLWALFHALVPWTPLLAWIAFWLFAVDWVRLREIQLRGGVIGLVLIALIAILVWGVAAPPESGRHSLLGLHVSNFFGKAIYVTALIVIMQLCGAVQLSGCCGSLIHLDVPIGGEGDHDQHHGGDGHPGGDGHYGHDDASSGSASTDHGHGGGH
jgi:hypothetical protein